MRAQQLRLYLITDAQLSRGRSEEDVVRAALAGGVTAVQLRGKDWTTRRLFEVGHRLRRLTREAGVLFLINDRVDVALAVGADGVHLGQDDMPLVEARRLLGKDAIIGISAETVAEAREAEAGGADYLGVGAVFATATKPEAPAIGLTGLRAICSAVRLPVVAIGGINAENLAAVLGAGAVGGAVVSAIVSAPDPGAAARRLAEAAGGEKEAEH